MRAITLYKYLFYKIYNGLKKIPRKDVSTEWSAMLIIMILSIANIYSLLDIIEFALWERIILDFNRVELTVFFFILMIPNYFIFIYKNKYKLIIKMFENEKEITRRRGNKVTAIIIIGTVILFLVLSRLTFILIK